MSREVYPGWTLELDGVAGIVRRTRSGAPVDSLMPGSPTLEAEVLSTFFDGIVVTYREDPVELFFNFRPSADVADYAVTNSFSELPSFPQGR